MTDNSILWVLGSSFATILLVMGFGFVFLNRNRDSKYNEKLHRIELDALRKNYESQIYNLNEKYVTTKEQWADSYHMQLSGNSASSEVKNTPVKINSFLLNAGLTEWDLVQERMVFVLTPFHPKYQGQFDIIKKTCEEAGFKCIRGDEQNFSSDIFPHVLKNIVKARIVIANVSGKNPNVLYELGLAHALDKTTIIVSQLLDDVPADIKSKKIVTFKDDISLKDNLKTELLRNLD
ncbi:hypothetical protein AO721_10760 [Aeromonas veronii]|uniref:hypothetical protein n=1 Tax=Aeromonas veronii TaxID=654 RepID=UPI0007184504|nr:hypothetical protein [Aeromonas veronii]KRV69375.1 hypothetical protein AO728_11990 [Aeromonas veronii]KRV73318.1 hypothetical protein AO719_07935 [Aeromonas veronii]KRV83415.1 hypothetical protein AO721_10760 [Aeromonas veronii]KRV83561.1 hypothetical protein AO739_09600 [Aeromonas veronii]